MTRTTLTIRFTFITALAGILWQGTSATLAGPPIENERIQWSFEFQSDLAGGSTAVAPDGTIYATDNLILYAINPDGSLQWTLPGAGGGRPIDVADDGTIYTGRGPFVFAVNPSGMLRWTFDLADSLVAGPSLGPDGNLYGATDNDPNNPSSNKGAFSIDPTTAGLRWTTHGNPLIFSLAGGGLPVVFADGQAVMGVTVTAAGGAAIWEFAPSGQQNWFGGDLDPVVFGKPTVDPFGRVITSGGNSVIATASDGFNVWQTQVPASVTGILPPVTDEFGAIYTADTIGGERWSLNPDGSTRYFVAGDGGIVNTLGVSPGGQQFLLGGNEVGEPGFVRAYSGDDGAPLWQITLDPNGGFNEFVWSQAFSFAQDSGTAYFTTRAGGDATNGRLYALTLSDTSSGRGHHGNGRGHNK
jgi:hypothetical protein